MKHKLIITVVGLFLGIGLVWGQDNCPVLVERALQAANDNCTELGRNTACYGYNQVQATFYENAGDVIFTQPSDRANLTELDTIQTAPLDEENDIWGVAMMSVQANVPDTLPGQAVIFMLMGDTKVENAVEPDEAFVPPDPIAVTTLVASSNIRALPSETGFVLGTVPMNTAFEADGLSSDGSWVRIIYQDQPAWIFRNIIDAESSLDGLPVISDENRTPMQAFYFSTGAGASNCNEAPDSLMIQGPNSLEVQINANGVDINIGSTIVLESAGENQVSITAINGYANVANVRIPGGFTIDARTDQQGTILPETLSGLRPMEDEKIERFSTLEKVRPEVINYQVNVLSREEINVVQYQLERGQIQDQIRNRCVEAGLTPEECRNFVSNEVDQQTIYERCLASGRTERQCREAVGMTSSTESGETVDMGTIAERCRLAGYETLEACREGYSGETDDRIQICSALGYRTRSECRDAFPEDSTEKILFCVSRGYDTKAECDAAFNGDTTVETVDDDSGSREKNECEERGLTERECQALRAYRECRSRGYTDRQCRQMLSSGGSTRGG